MNALLERSKMSRNWFALNPLRNTLGLIFIGVVAFASTHLGWAQTSLPVATALSAISSQSAGNFQMTPVNQGTGTPPLVMLVMSRDEQLSIKAYSDYTSLSGSGPINSTYTDTFSYGGYFDSGICYAYTGITTPLDLTTTGVFKASAYATGTNGHSCSGQWSGNFLNWLTMTRMDIVRQVLFGGKRSTDTSTQTILQRAYLPDDVHSFQKVYPNSDINLYTPYSTYPMSFCNTTNVNSPGSLSGYLPLLRVAAPVGGTGFPQWAATEARQCDWRDDITGSQTQDQPYSTTSGSQELKVFVDVCDNPNVREKFCRQYTVGNTSYYKPAGLLQSYGESLQLRFGLMTGTYDHPRTGGAVRRNIGQLAYNNTTTADANGCATGDEIGYKTGVFCFQGAGNEGIINTISRLQITQWPGYPGAPFTATYSDCNPSNADGTLSNWANDRGYPASAPSNVRPSLQYSPSTDSTHVNNACADEHNPLAEIYGEALRYFEGSEGTGQTANYQPGAGSSVTAKGYSIDEKLGLPGTKNYPLTAGGWTDPYDTVHFTNYCAQCSIILLTTGFGSFDSDEIDSSGYAPIKNLAHTSAAAATTNLGTTEQTLSGVSGSGASPVSGSDIIGYYGTTPTQTGADITSGATTNAVCSAKNNVTDFSLVRGICPEQPALEGSYLLAGLAFDAWTATDLRPTLSTNSQVSFDHKVKTYAVSLAETLPSLSLITPSGGTITLSPLCQNLGLNYPGISNGNPSGFSSTGSGLPYNFANYGTVTDPGTSTCSLVDVSVQPLTAASSNPVPFSAVTFGLPMTTNSAGNVVTGSAIYTWDDQPAGNDHDRDIVNMITYCVGTACTGTGICQDHIFASADGATLETSATAYRNACTGVTSDGKDDSVGTNQVLVRVEAISASDSNSLAVGFTATGTTVDASKTVYTPILRYGNGGITSSVLTGAYLPGYAVNNNPSGDPVGCENSNNCQVPRQGPGVGNAPVVTLLSASGTAPANSLQNPLFYAAKYGGFIYKTTDSPRQPAAQSSWDQVNNFTGQSPADGLPDNYFPLRNPSQLSAQLSKVFSTIVGTTGSGTAAAVVANQRQGDGAAYQAYYVPTLSDNNGNTANWLGSLQSFFTDQQGNLREDPTHSGILNETSFSANPAVSIFYDNVATDPTYGQTVFNRYSGTCGPFPVTVPACVPTSTYLPLSQLNPLWNARDKLANVTSVTANRSYSATADTGRYIFTFIDNNLNGTVDSGETVPFALSSFSSGSSNTYGLLNVSNSASAQEIINYIRGQDYQGLRNRTINYNSTGTSTLTYSLGDIVDSSPSVVGSPQENYDLLYNDATFATFKSKYLTRRNVVYVGADDGMLHAFNAGFYSASNDSFNTTPIDGTSATAHPLGTELWAYVPFNLLPHLLWLTSTSYGHIFYVDGTPKVFDARVFTPDTNHPGGWGTVLVVGFRFGGGDIDLPASNCTYATAFNGFSPVSTVGTKTCTGNTVPAKDIQTHSAYVVMDITNPENPPILMAEVTGTANAATTPGVLGFTTSSPAMVPFSKVGGTTMDNWYLTFGNGPTDIGTASSSSGPLLYIYKLVSSALTQQTPLTLPGSGFTGDPIAVDWNLDFVTDALFVGTASGSAPTSVGQLVKIDTSASSAPTTPTAWVVSTLTNPMEPIPTAPTAALDNLGQHWIYAGSGRLYVNGDKASNVTQQSLFGVIEQTAVASSSCTSPPCFTQPVTYTSLTDVTSAVFTQTGNAPVVLSGVSGATTEAALEALVQTNLGWKIKLNLPGTTTSIPTSMPSAERVLNQTTLYAGTLLATTYTPDTNLCTGAGSSRLFAVNYITGVVNPSLPALASTINGTVTTFNSNVSEGPGEAAGVSLGLNASTGTNASATANVNNSLGAINQTALQFAPTSKNGEIDWRESLPNSN